MGLNSWYDLLRHPVCAHHIQPHLSLIDLMSLKRAIKGVRVNVFECFINRLAAWFTKKAFPDTLIAFIIGQLCNPRGFIHLTGSLAVMLMTDESWEVGDVDLICTCPYAQLDRAMYEKYDLTWAEPVHQRRQPRESPLYKTSSALIHVTNRYINANGFKVQFLEVDKDAVDTYIHSFDLSFCKILMGHGKIRIFEPHDLLKRRMNRTVGVFATYFPHNIAEPSHLFHNYLPQRYFRLRKYVQRGFDITLDVSIDRNVDMLAGYIQKKHCSKSFNMGMLTAYWHMFWGFCVDKEGKLIVDAMPQWKL